MAKNSQCAVQQSACGLTLKILRQEAVEPKQERFELCTLSKHVDLQQHADQLCLTCSLLVAYKRQVH